MSASDRETRLRQRLESRFAPTILHIVDESHLHAGHAGAADGRGHFRIRILETDIHALAIEALPPLER
jgi:BolA family transcriptional regulator, general stress-responsive regulator